MPHNQEYFKPMKKLTLALIAAITLASCSPLRVALNYTDKNGVKTICTTDIDLFDSFEVAMGERIEGNDTVLSLLITSTMKSDHGIFEKGDKLMMRLNNDSEIVLTNLYDKEYKEETTTHYTQDRIYDDGFAYSYSPFTGSIYVTPYTLTRMVPRRYITHTTKSFALYLISKQQVLDIIEKGVKKLRVEIETTDCDMPHPEDTGETIQRLYEFVKTIPAQKREKF